MNTSKYQAICLFFFIFAMGTTTVAHANSIKGAELTVYNSGRALVTESRSVNLPEGMAGVVFKSMPATVDPTSVYATAKDMRVLDVQYAYTPITQANLLKRFVGKEVMLIMPDPTDANGRVQRKAKLLSMTGKPIFMVGEEVYAGSVDGIFFPELPQDLQTEPTLTLTTDSAVQGKRNVSLSYLMGGLSWSADYTLSIGKDGKTGALGAWATIVNTSGGGFVGADLKLVAGDVASANGGRRFAKVAQMESDMVAAAPAPPQRESFSQFHVYSVDRPISFAANTTHRINLFSAPKVQVKEQLISIYHGNVGPRARGADQNVAVNLLLKNSSEGGLDQPMPGGVVRVLRPASDGSLLLAGESHISHVGRGEEVVLPLGKSFDVNVKRTRIAYQKTGKNVHEVVWKLEVTNGSDKSQQLILRDNYSGQWEVLSSDQEYKVADSNTLEFILDVPPNGNGQPTVVNYTVQVTY